MRREIIRDRAHAISTRGDKMIIIDPMLRDLGFQSITFEAGEVRPKIKATIALEHYQFQVLIDEDLQFKEMNTLRGLAVSFENRAFLEHIVLSHLKELQCGARAVAGDREEGSREESVERQKEFTDRRGHLRKLRPGRGYRETQRLWAFDEQRWDLARINAEQGLTRETGQKTYVKEKKDVRIGGRLPLVSRAPQAMNRYRALLNQP